MPYALKGNCVVRADTGDVVKCHPTRAKARRHLIALKVNVEDKEAGMSAVGRLMAKLGRPAEVVELARVYIPPHKRVVGGKTVNVDGYWREVAVGDRVTIKGPGTREGSASGTVTKVSKEGLTIENPSASSGRLTPRMEKIRTAQVHELEVTERNADRDRLRSDTRLGKAMVDATRAQRQPGETDVESRGPLTKSGHRSLSTIASEIYRDWGKQKGGVNFAAKPYLDALRDLDDITDQYMADNARTIVMYFMSNASQWRGPKAKEIKAELKGILKRAR